MRAVGLQHAPRRRQPGAGEGVVGGEARELVPVRRRRASTSDWSGRCRSPLELQIVGRIGEDQVDRLFRQPVERGDAIADQHLVEKNGRMSGVLVNPIFVPTLAPLTVTGMVNRRLGVN